MDWRKNWRGIVGAIGWLPGLWNGARWLADWGGRIDFMADSLPTWAEGTMNWLPAAPPWIVFPGALIGFVLIWADTRRSRSPMGQSSGSLARPTANPKAGDHTAWQDRSLWVPRRETVYPTPALTPAELFEALEPYHVPVMHIMAQMDDVLMKRAQRLFSIARSVIQSKEIGGEPLSKDDEENLRKIAGDDFIYLKGNDIWTYTYRHFKRLPERLEPAPPGEPYDTELQIHIAFGPPPPADDDEAKPSIVVDNGQPRWVPSWREIKAHLGEERPTPTLPA